MAEKRKCYGEYSSGQKKCGKCLDEIACRSFTGRKNSPTRGLSKGMAIRAFCKYCNGGTLRAGCTDHVCPFYAYLREIYQDAGPPNLWWTQPMRDWDRLEEEARKEKREIRRHELPPEEGDEGGEG